MDKIWGAIRYLIEFKRKELLLCKWCDKEGLHVAISIANKSEISMSLSFKVTDNPEEGYELSLDKDGEIVYIGIPADVIGKMYYDRLDKVYEVSEEDCFID